MNEWVKVDVPTQFPMRCTTCQNAKDLLDTWVELPGGWRVYYCKVCARHAARAFGFSKGKEQDRLANATDVLAEKDKEIADYKRLYEDARERTTMLVADGNAKADHIVFLEGRLEQLTQRLAGEGRALLELVSTGPEDAA